MSLDIKELLKAVAEDNRNAYNKFYDLFYMDVFRFCFSYLQNSEACKEIVSEVFFSVWKYRHRLPEVANISVYLYVMTRNRVLNYLRTQSPFNLVSLDEVSVFYETSDSSSSPSNDIESKELNELLTSIVNGLPDKMRMIFMMVRVNGLKYKEVAEIMGIKESTVRVQMKAAANKIYSLIKLLYQDILR